MILYILAFHGFLSVFLEVNKHMMSGINFSRAFARSCSKFHLNNTENAINSDIQRLREKALLLDGGRMTSRTATQDSPTTTALNPRAGETLLRRRDLDMIFMDLVAGNSQLKQQAAGRFRDLTGLDDVDAGEALRRKQALLEMKTMFRRNRRVKGFLLNRVGGGYAVAVSGYVAFLPNVRFRAARIPNDRFSIRDMDLKTLNIVLF